MPAAHSQTQAIVDFLAEGLADYIYALVMDVFNFSYWWWSLIGTRARKASVNSDRESERVLHRKGQPVARGSN
jgi:hypothetical protein